MGQSESLIKLKIYYTDCSPDLLNPYISLTLKKIRLVCHDIPESSIDFYFIVCSFISFKEAKKAPFTRKEKKKPL